MIKIYALMSGQLVLYVGQTRSHLNKRRREHQCKTNTSSSREIPEHIEWEIQLLEECSSESSNARERYWYESLKPLYNRAHPGLSRKETRQQYSLRQKSTKEHERQKHVDQPLWEE
jgi:hypothetical protein